MQGMSTRVAKYTLSSNKTLHIHIVSLSDYLPVETAFWKNQEYLKVSLCVLFRFCLINHLSELAGDLIIGSQNEAFVELTLSEDAFSVNHLQ